MSSVPPSVEISAAAEADLREIRDYIATRNPEAAARLIQNALQAVRFLRTNPEIGPRVPDRDDGLRSLGIPEFRAYRLYYQYDTARDRLRLVRLLHTARDPDDLLSH